MKALVIPMEGPLYEIEEPSLAQLQRTVGGFIEAVGLPAFIRGGARATAYVNEEGKYKSDCKPNMRATDFMVPGVGLFTGDYVAGNFVLCGLDPATGEHDELPKGVIDRARLIEREAGR